MGMGWSSEDLAGLRQRAEEGDVEAQYHLGLMYRTGDDVLQDGVEAVKWYRLAADQDKVEAQYDLGLMFYEGEVVRQDYMEAVKWYRKAAEECDQEALFTLGVMYRKGLGVLQDYTESHKWHNLAAGQVWAAVVGFTEQKRFADARDAVAKLMPPKQIAEAQRLAREWMTLHPDVGFRPSHTVTDQIGTRAPAFGGKSEESIRRDQDQEDPSVRDWDQGGADADGDADGD